LLYLLIIFIVRVIKALDASNTAYEKSIKSTKDLYLDNSALI